MADASPRNIQFNDSPARSPSVARSPLTRAASPVRSSVIASVRSEGTRTVPTVTRSIIPTSPRKPITPKSARGSSIREQSVLADVEQSVSSPSVIPSAGPLVPTTSTREATPIRASVADSSDESVNGEPEIGLTNPLVDPILPDSVEDDAPVQLDDISQQDIMLQAEERRASYTPSRRYDEEVITDPGEPVNDDDSSSSSSTDDQAVLDAAAVEQPALEQSDFENLAQDGRESTSSSDTEEAEAELSLQNEANDSDVDEFAEPEGDLVSSQGDRRSGEDDESITDSELDDSGQSVYVEDPEALPSPPPFLAENLPIKSPRDPLERMYVSHGFKIMQTIHLYKRGALTSQNHYLVQMRTPYGDILFMKFNTPVIMGEGDPSRIPLNITNVKINCPSEEFQSLMKADDIITVFSNGIIFEGKIYTSKDNETNVDISSGYVYPVYIHFEETNFIKLCTDAREFAKFLEVRMKDELQLRKKSLIRNLQTMIKMIKNHHDQIENIDAYRTTEANKLYGVFSDGLRRRQPIPSGEDTHRINHLTDTMIRYTTSHLNLWCTLNSKFNDAFQFFEEASPHIYAQIQKDYPELTM